MGQHDNGHVTEPVDYAKLNAVYGVLLAGAVVATRRSAKNSEPIPVRVHAHHH